MLGSVVGAMVATLVQEATDAPPAGSVATALIGSGASLLLNPRRRPVGLALLAAGGMLLWRQAAVAQRQTVRVRAARVRPAPNLPSAASASAG